MSVPSDTEVLEIDGGRPDELVARMDELADAGAGWVNLQPGIDPDDAPQAEPGLFGLFSGRGPVVPVATWTAPAPTRRGGRGPEEVGIQHPAGPRAAARLAEAGVPVPAGWRVVQDHPRRGLVAQVAPGTPHREVAEWLLGATARLAAVPVTGWWRATVHRG